MKKAHISWPFVILALGISLGLPARADPPNWAPAHGHRAKQQPVKREYRYVYYPAQQVYYAPATGSWFWMNGGNWQVGVNLPTPYRAHVTSGVQVVLNSPRPYVQHAHVEQQYGRPWREKHRHAVPHKVRHKDERKDHHKTREHKNDRHDGRHRGDDRHHSRH